MDNLTEVNLESTSSADFGTNASLVFASFCFFIGLQFYVAGQCVPRNLKKSDDIWKWINIMVSFSHSFMMTILLAFSFYVYPEILTSPLTFQNTHINMVICFTTGYFIWDVYDMAQSGRLLKLWEVVVHHAGVLSTLFYNLTANMYPSLSLIALTVEANSVFLHARKLLQMSGRVPFSSWFYVKVCQINLLTFVGLRGTVLLYGTWAVYHYFDVFTNSYLHLLGSALVTSWPMNLVLFWRLVRSDILRNMKSSSSSQRRRNNGKIPAKEAIE